jgi:hypothetical protein
LQEFESIIQTQKKEIEFLKSTTFNYSEYNDLKLEFSYLKYENSIIKKALEELKEKSIKDRSDEERNERNLSEIKGEIETLKVKSKNKIRDIKLENASIKKSVDLMNVSASKTLEDAKKQLEENFNKIMIQKQTELSSKYVNSKNPSTNVFLNPSLTGNIKISEEDLEEAETLAVPSKALTEEYKFELYGLKYSHPDNFDHTIICHKELPKHFKAKIRVSPCDKAWFAFGVANKKAPTDNKRFMWCTEGIPDCYVYNSNGMVSDSEDSKKYGETYWQKVNEIAIILDKENNISFEKNGISLGIAFKNVEGPFYLAASFLYKGYEVELLEVIEL